MPVITEQVDIYQLPVGHVPRENGQVTIGDLHGNSMKLMFMLIKEGIATGVTLENYAKLVEIYKKPVITLTREDIDEFKRILASINYKNQTAVRLIGDELADRGSNDYFTLKILKKLQENQVPVEIIISNHSIEFLLACEKQPETKHFKPPILRNGHAASLENLNVLVEKGLVEADEVLSIAQTAYKPNLKAISYSLNDDASEITLYSHAGIGLNTIKDLAIQFKVSYLDSTAVSLARTINRINHKFQECVIAGTVTKLCPAEAMNLGYTGNGNLNKTPLVCAMWNRRYDLIDRPARKKLFIFITRYNLVYVHGHDSADPEKDMKLVVNLDKGNDLGKFAHFNSGTYSVLESTITPLEKSLNTEINGTTLSLGML